MVGYAVFSLPTIAFAALPSLIPCDGVSKVCDVAAFMTLINNLINYAFYFSVPIIAIAMIYAGYEFIVGAMRGNPGQVGDAKKMFGKILWGFVFMLTAWLIVSLITGLLDKGFSYLN